MTEQLPSVFIGSSSEGHRIAREVELQLVNYAAVSLWTNGIFVLGRGTLESLMNVLDDFDFAIMVLSPDDLLETRGQNHTSPRDNVLFELGLFMGRLGRERTFILSEEGVDLKLPSDLAGIARATYRKVNDQSLARAVSPACTQMIQSIEFLGRKERVKKDENTERILATCRRKGIMRIHEDGELGTVLGKPHVASSQKIRIMQTSGIGLTKQLKAEIIAALEHSNTSIHILIAKSDGDFIREVELMEGQPRVGNIVPEIRSVEGVLKECVDEAKDKYSGQDIGKIYLGYYNTHFRSSLLICDDQWCWMTLILPPKRAPLSVSFELGRSSNPLIDDCIRHFDKAWELVEKREIT